MELSSVKLSSGVLALFWCFLSVASQDVDLNLAPDVSEDYPVIFTIILFISISLILALIAISVALATMDPGKDSLIYRVTSGQRFKKEN